MDSEICCLQVPRLTRLTFHKVNTEFLHRTEALPTALTKGSNPPPPWPDQGILHRPSGRSSFQPMAPNSSPLPPINTTLNKNPPMELRRRDAVLLLVVQKGDGSCGSRVLGARDEV